MNNADKEKHLTWRDQTFNNEKELSECQLQEPPCVITWLPINLNATDDYKVAKPGDLSCVSYEGSCSQHSNHSFAPLKVNSGHVKYFLLQC